MGLIIKGPPSQGYHNSPYDWMIENRFKSHCISSGWQKCEHVIMVIAMAHTDMVYSIYILSFPLHRHKFICSNYTFKTQTFSFINITMPFTWCSPNKMCPSTTQPPPGVTSGPTEKTPPKGPKIRLFPPSTGIWWLYSWQRLPGLGGGVLPIMCWRGKCLC